jgi:hypothetical protein
MIKSFQLSFYHRGDHSFASMNGWNWYNVLYKLEGVEALVLNFKAKNAK